MTPDEQMAAYMNRLDFVKWDRLVRLGARLKAYGWIDRPGSEADGRADFVLLVFDVREGDDVFIDFTTSSASYSEEICRRLFDTAAGHVDCERVDDVFGELVPRTVRSSRPAWSAA